jgi:hypothetical protein
MRCCGTWRMWGLPVRPDRWESTTRVARSSPTSTVTPERRAGLEYVAPFRDDAECLRWLHYPAPPDRRLRLEHSCSAYGLDSAVGIVDAVIAGQQDNADLVRRLAEQGHEPQATWAADGLLTELDHRIDWSKAHRHLVE